jgi:hypothetical protein
MRPPCPACGTAVVAFDPISWRMVATCAHEVTRTCPPDVFKAAIEATQP